MLSALVCRHILAAVDSCCTKIDAVQAVILRSQDHSEVYMSTQTCQAYKRAPWPVSGLYHQLPACPLHQTNPPCG